MLFARTVVRWRLLPHNHYYRQLRPCAQAAVSDAFTRMLHTASPTRAECAVCRCCSTSFARRLGPERVKSRCDSFRLHSRACHTHLKLRQTVPDAPQWTRSLARGHPLSSSPSTTSRSLLTALAMSAIKLNAELFSKRLRNVYNAWNVSNFETRAFPFRFTNQSTTLFPTPRIRKRRTTTPP